MAYVPLADQDKEMNFTIPIAGSQNTFGAKITRLSPFNMAARQLLWALWH